MYNQPQTYLTRGNIIRAVGLIIFIGLIIYIVTHGFLTITNFPEGQSVRHTSFAGNLSVASSGTTSQSVKILPSGGYSVLVLTQSGGVDAHFAPVPNFMQTAGITAGDRATDIRVVARGTPARMALDANGALVGWDDAGAFKGVASDTIDNSGTDSTTNVFFPNFERAVQINATTIGGITSAEGEYVPTYFDFTTNDNKVYDAITSDTAVYARDEAAGFSAYVEKDTSLNYYEPSKDKAIGVKLPEAAATIDGIPLTSAGPSVAAAVTGGSLFSINEDEEVEVEPANLKLRIIDTKTGDELKSKSLDETQLRDIRLSADGKNVYIQTDQSFFILDTTDLKVRYAAHVTIHQFKWASGDSFVFSTTDQGIFAGSITGKRASTLAPYRLVQPTEISFIKDDVVTFTAYSRSNDGAINPDVYQVNLNAKKTGESLNLITKFPYQGEEYYADYVNGKVVVQLTKYISSTGESVNEDAKVAAQDYAREVFGETIPEIIYTYVISDLRAPTSTD